MVTQLRWEDEVIWNGEEVKQKVLSNAEGDVGSMSRRVLLLEEEDERSEERLAKTVTQLSQ